MVTSGDGDRPADRLDIRMLRLREVARRTGLSRSTIYAFVADGRFPPPVALGPRIVGWVESEIVGWIAERIRDAREVAAR